MRTITCGCCLETVVLKVIKGIHEVSGSLQKTGFISCLCCPGAQRHFVQSERAKNGFSVTWKEVHFPQTVKSWLRAVPQHCDLSDLSTWNRPSIPRTELNFNSFFLTFTQSTCPLQTKLSSLIFSSLPSTSFQKSSKKRVFCVCSRKLSNSIVFGPVFYLLNPSSLYFSSPCPYLFCQKYSSFRLISPLTFPH